MISCALRAVGLFPVQKKKLYGLQRVVTGLGVCAYLETYCIHDIRYIRSVATFCQNKEQNGEQKGAFNILRRILNLSSAISNNADLLVCPLWRVQSLNSFNSIFYVKKISKILILTIFTIINPSNVVPHYGRYSLMTAIYRFFHSSGLWEGLYSAIGRLKT